MRTNFRQVFQIDAMPGFIRDVDAMHSCIPTFIELITFTRKLIRLPRPGAWVAEGAQRQRDSEASSRRSQRVAASETETLRQEAHSTHSRRSKHQQANKRKTIEKGYTPRRVFMLKRRRNPRRFFSKAFFWGLSVFWRFAPRRASQFPFLDFWALAVVSLESGFKRECF